MDNQIKENNYSEVSVADFFKSVDQNINNSIVLVQQNPLLLKDKDVLNYIFANYSELPDVIVSKIIESGIEITFEDVKKYESIRNCLKLLNYVYEKDPKVFLLFPREYILYRVARDAVNKGVYATKEDILFNPILKDIAPIMEASIKKDPEILKYVTVLTGIQLDKAVITDALSKYKLTEEDLLKNPDLCSIFNIMSQLPEYRLYSAHLTYEDRIEAIEKLLKEESFDEVANLPFFKKELEGKASNYNVKWLLNFIYKKIDEENIFEQKRYQRVLDHLVDGVVDKLYYDNKNNFDFSDTVAIVNELKSSFYTAKEKNTEQPIIEFANKIKSFVNIDLKGKELLSNNRLMDTINELYNKFLEDENILYTNAAAVFYNEILNIHRNSYCSIEKSKILSKIKYMLPLREKKVISILNGKKIIQISTLLATHKYEVLGVTREYLKNRLSVVVNEIASNKDLLNSYGKITPEKLEYFNALFLNSGQLDYLTIAHTLGTTDNEIIHYIFKKYEQIKVDLLDRIELKKDDKHISEQQISKIGLNVVNFKIVNKEKYISNIANLLLNITDEDIELIKNSEPYIKEILTIIPFMDLIPELNVELIIKILRNYGKIKSRMIGENSFIVSDTVLISKFHEVISLANGYDLMNNLYDAILGHNTVEEIGIKDSKKYYDFYFRMRNKVNCSIPKVSGEYENIVYESGNFSDVDRLLIGKKYNYSCVDLTNTAGRDTFIECLAEDNGDVIMIRDKKTGEFIARALIFRRGNVVQIAKIYCIDGTTLYYADEFFQNIAQQIFDAANKVNDNIDYVFVTKEGIKKTEFKEYENIFFETAFPHADLWKYSYLVAANPKVKDKDVESNLDFFSKPKETYLKVRSVVTNEASDEELTRIKVLNIAMEKDDIIKQKLEETFEPFYRRDYLQVLSGEDWYIALKENGEIEEVVLPSEDPRTYIEFENAKIMIKSFKNNNNIINR